MRHHQNRRLRQEQRTVRETSPTITRPQWLDFESSGTFDAMLYSRPGEYS
jgi:hypothetical protein